MTDHQLKTNASHAIYHDLVIDTPLEKVFEAISQPEHLINWWPLRCSGVPQVGSEYNFYFSDEYDWYGEVIHCKHNEAFHVKMTNADSDWNTTTFGFDLQEERGTIQVQFWHIGWPSCNAHYRRSSFCWAILLNGLKNYLEKGIIVPFEDRE